MKILFAASEIFPYAKSGGLADVAYALPKALKKHLDIVSVMPLYGFLNIDALKKSKIFFDVKLGSKTHKIDLYTADNRGIKTYFIHSELISNSKDFYSDKSGAYANNNINFGIFCAAIVELAKHLNVDILHLNDWHSAMSALWIKEKNLNIKTLFTIHNLAYQGLFQKEIIEDLGIDKKYFNMDGVEFYNQLSFIKAGIAYSDAITTVSPQYAKDIMSQRFGCGLNTFLKKHSKKVRGILNGIDYELFNPATDSAIASKFSLQNIKAKEINKKALLKELAFEPSQKPLFIMIARLVEQKGFELLLESLEDLLKNDLNFVVVGDGVSSYKHKLEIIAKKHDNFRFIFGYDEDFSHRLYAGADFLVMPSLFEPCGLNQMIAMRYGTIAIVHAVGGLFDSVSENKMKCGEGIVFHQHSKDAFLKAILRALKLNKDRKKMKKIIDLNMKCDFSFEKSALSYMKVYKDLLI
nr:glycogen/starch synthase [uncultured Sulfurimonas sp.]